MATSSSVCAVCDLQHQTTQSTHWCIECEEPLCADCKEHHNVLKATRNHKTIPISDYHLLPSVVTELNQHCVYHNERYQLYCIKHESPICNKCVKHHGKCGEILSLDEIVRDIKTSESFVDLEESLDDLLTNINLIRKDRESNTENITDQKNKIAEQVCHLKNQVIQHVNKLEEEFIKELNQIEFSCCDPIRSIVSSLQDKAKETNQMKSEIKNTKKYASDLQTFLSMRAIQAKTTEIEKHLQSSIENECHETINIESALDTKIQDILMVYRFGSIKVKKSLSTEIDHHRRNDRQAQIMVPKESKTINTIKIELKRKMDIACKFLYGCCVTTTSSYLFVSYNCGMEKIIAIDNDCKVEYAIPITTPYRAFDIVCFEDTTAAVSTGSSNFKVGIFIVNLNTRKVMQLIALPGHPYVITYDGKSLICCVKNKDIHVISCADYSITTIPNTVSSSFSFVSTHDNKIFLSMKKKTNSILLFIQLDINMGV